MAATATHYDLGMSMIRHFRGQLTLRYLAPKYEALVTDSAAVIGQILAFIGAPDCPDAALRDNKPVALRRTPAHMAGQCPVHTAGLWRHRHYESLVPGLFTEARPILAPWIGRLGYGDAP